MAFYESRNPEQINYIGVPVSVAVSFKSSGEMLPLQMVVHDEYGDPLRVKIDGVKYTKDIKVACLTGCYLKPVHSVESVLLIIMLRCISGTWKHSLALC
jgi:hypothetical protein